MNLADTVSVVVPCYNASAWIAGALQSVLSQDWPRLEVIVVDDGSTDGSVELVKSRFPQVRVIRQANAGAAAARNTGIGAASGQWIAFIDADDWWLPGKLHAQMRLLAENPEAQLCCTSWKVWESTELQPPPALFSGDDDTSRSGIGQVAEKPRWIYPELLLGCCVWTSTVVARTELLRTLQGFDTSLRIGEDYDLWLRASRLTPIVRVMRPMALYRQHPESLTKQAPAYNYEAEVVGRALSRWGYSSPDGRRASSRAVARSLARTWHSHGSAQLAAGKIKPALASAARSISLCWTASAGWKLTARALVEAASWSRSTQRV